MNAVSAASATWRGSGAVRRARHHHSASTAPASKVAIASSSKRRRHVDGGRRTHRHAHRPGVSHEADARNKPLEIALDLRRVGRGRHAHHPLAHRVDDVQVILERVARRGFQPRLDHGARQPQRGHRRRSRQRLAQLGLQRGLVGDQPDLVDAVAIAAQHLAQLALQEQALLAGRVASRRADHHQQPLPLQACAAARRHLADRGPRRRAVRRWAGSSVP